MYTHVLPEKSHKTEFGKKIAGAVGIEPTSTVLETAVLPLNYAPVSGSTEAAESYYILFCMGMSTDFHDDFVKCSGAEILSLQSAPP